MASRGVLYIATGKKYVEATINSARTVRDRCPGLEIHLYTDPKSYTEFGFADSPQPFTTISKIDNPHRRSKVDYICRTPYDRTLYLDSDTAVNSNIEDIFRVLDRFDIALAHAHHRNTDTSLSAWRVNIPDAFPQFNSGVMLFRTTPEVLQLLRGWSSAFQESGARHDQPTLRELLWLSNLRIATLPPEYNVRFLKYKYIWNKSEAEIKIFHLKQLHEGWMKWVFRDWNKYLRKIRKRIKR
jgi:hypothetical protein